ncbi:hypothetical protein [Micromonospora inaquosa]|nr:hypothetical protein [Micromonospora inaquosa]
MHALLQVAGLVDDQDLWVPESRPLRLSWGFVGLVPAGMIGEWHYDWST